MSQDSPTVHLVAVGPRGQVCGLLPVMARKALLEARDDMKAINAAHRLARAICPQHFNMEDDSFSVKEPKPTCTQE